jgi:nucleotide-binding universal stress UspA family protein
MFKKILVLYDLSRPSQRGLAWAVRMAAAFGSKLKVALILGSEELRGQPKASPTGYEGDFERLIRQDLERHARRLPEADAKAALGTCGILVSPGDPSTALLKLIEKERPGLVIVGSHGRTALARVVLGSVAERIVRHSPSPVLVARTDPAWPLSAVLVPLDFSETDEEALHLAAVLASAVPAAFELLHVLPYREVAGLIYPEAVAAWSAGEKSEREREAEKEIREAAARHPQLKATPLVSVGAPADEILDEARGSAADLILIATHGRTGLPRLFLGSVAEQVIRYAPCSVLAFSPRRALEARRQAVQALADPGGDSLDLGTGD